MKTNFKKFLAVISAAATAMSCITAPVFADELQQSDTSVWNYDLIEEGSEQLYSDFPFSMHKLKGQEMNINICFLYLKNMSTDDIIDITVKDSDTNAVVLTKTLSADDHSFLIENPDMGKTFSISVNETLDGVTKQYSGYLETLFTEADFPVDMTLGDKVIENNAGETFSSVRYKKVGDSPVCQHENDEDCTEACNEISVVHTIQPSELNTFYNTLDSNCFYEMQVTAFKGTSSSNYYGYISTYNGGEDMGIFIPNFTFRKVRDRQEITQMSRPAPYATNVSGDDYFPNATDYNYYETVYVDFSQTLYHCYKFQALETDTYVIETIGNLDIQFNIYTQTGNTLNTRPSVVKSGGEGANPRTEYSWLVDPDEGYTAPTLYIEVELETGNTGVAGFRISKEGEFGNPNDHNNFIDEVKAQCDLGNYSPLDITEDSIDYHGDVDIFGYQGTAGNGYAYLHSVGDIYCSMYYVDGIDDNGFETLWYNEEIQPGANPTSIECYNKRQYFIIKQLPGAVGGNECYVDYEFGYYDPRRPDEYEGETLNNTPYNATVLTNYPSDTPNEYFLDSGTLGRSETDFFTFTTGNSDADLYVRLEKNEVPYLYNLTLYDDDELEYTDSTHTSWRWLSTMATGTANSSQTMRTIEIDDLKPNHKYYIRISRPNSTSYNSYYPYRLVVRITNVAYTATLSEDVQLSHTVGNNITSTDSFKETVNSKLTCTKNGSAISSSDALADLELYYNNEPLTASIVNSLTAGTYTIVPKYKNTAATGGTVTLTVTAPVTADIAEITDIDNEPVILESMDWLAAAKIMANVRLRRENSTLNTTDLFQAAADLEWDDFDARGTAADTVRAATYFYTNGSSQTGNRFISSSVNSSTAENTLYNSINQGKSVAMLLTSTNGTTDMSLARYLVLFGVDKTNHRMKVMDPISGGNATWIDSSILFDGGYDGDSSLRFTGRIIEGI